MRANPESATEFMQAWGMVPTEAPLPPAPVEGDAELAKSITVDRPSTPLPTIAKLAPPTYPSVADEFKAAALEQAAAAATRGPDWLDIGAAAVYGTIPNTVLRHIDRSGIPDDPSWKLDQATLDRLSEGIDPDLRFGFADAFSLSQAEALRSQYRAQTDARDVLRRAGWSGFGAQVLSSVTDPAYLAVGVLTGGAGTAGQAASLTGRLQGLIRAGLIAGAPFAALEGYKATQDPAVTGGDVLTAGLSGFGFGVGSAATAKAGRVARFFAGGTGGAAPQMASDLIRGHERSEIMLNGAMQMVMGGVFNSLHSTRAGPELPDVPAVQSKTLEAAARAVAKDVEFEAVKVAAKAAGQTPDNVLTPDGKAYFKDQLDTAARDAAVVRAVVGPEQKVSFNETPATVAASPVSSAQRVTDWADARIAELEAARAQRSIPRGPNVGATTLFDDLMDSAQIAVLKAIKAGANTAEMLTQVVRDVIASHREQLTPEQVASLERIAPTMMEQQQKYLQELGAAGSPPGGTGILSPAAPAAPLAPKRFDDLDLSNVRNVPVAKYGTKRQFRIGETAVDVDLIRNSMGGMVGQSPVPEIRDIGAMTLPDPLPRDGGGVVNVTAHDWADVRFRAWSGEFTRQADAAYAAYLRGARESGSTPLSRSEFMEAVSGIVRGDPAAISDAAALQFADRVRGLVGEFPGMLQRHAVPASDRFGPSDTYLPRVYLRSKLDELVRRFGIDEATRLFAEAVAAKSIDVDSELASRIGRAIVRKGGTSAKDNDFTISMLFKDRAAMAEAIREASPELTAAQIADISDRLFGKAESGPSMTRKRVDMDETFSTELVDQATGELVSVSILDVLENDVEQLLPRYARQAFGAAALHEVLRNAPPRADGTPPATIEGLMTVLQARAKAAGVDAGPDLAKIETGLRLAAGLPVDTSHPAKRTAFRVLRNFLALRFLSNAKTGARNFLELAGGLTEFHASVVLRNVPGIMGIARDMIAGRVNNATVREMGHLIAAGEDLPNVRSPGRAHMDGTTVGRVEQLSSQAARIGTTIGLIRFTQTWLERSVASMIADQWFLAAKMNRGPGSFRLRGMGIDPKSDLPGRILDQVRKHATGEASWLGQKVSQLNLDRWTDVEAAMRLRNAMELQAHRLVQQSNPTAYARWMTSDTGKLLAQLKTFAFTAHTNKLLYGIQASTHGEASAFIGMTMATATQALFYVVSTYADAMLGPSGEPRRRQLRERLTAAQIARSSFAQSSWSALLPTAYDTMAPMVGLRAQFEGTRTSGLKTGALDGIPAMAWLNDVYRARSSIFGPISRDYSFSREDVAALQGAAFMPRVYGLQHMLNRMIRRLPARSVEPER